MLARRSLRLAALLLVAAFARAAGAAPFLAPKPLLVLSDGDLAAPALTPSGRTVAVSRVVLRPTSSDELDESTEILACAIRSGACRTLLGADAARQRGAYGAFVISQRWLDEARLEVVLGDGDVGATTLVLDGKTGAILSESRDDGEAWDRIHVQPAGPAVDRVLAAHPEWKWLRYPMMVAVANGEVEGDAILVTDTTGGLARFGPTSKDVAWTPSAGLHVTDVAAVGPRILAVASSPKGWEIALIGERGARVLASGAEPAQHRWIRILREGRRSAAVLLEAHRGTETRILVRLDGDAGEPCDLGDLGDVALADASFDARGRLIAVSHHVGEERRVSVFRVRKRLP